MIGSSELTFEWFVKKNNLPLRVFSSALIEVEARKKITNESVDFIFLSV